MSEYSYAEILPPNGTYFFPNWQRNKTAALSITFDDGSKGQFLYAQPAMTARGLHATFFIMTNFFTEYKIWYVVRKAAMEGHEIESHTLSHPDLTTAANPDSELCYSQKIINDSVPSQRCQTLAYPFYKVNDTVESITRKYFIAARAGVGASNAVNPPNPPNMYQLSTGGGVESAIANKGWFIRVFHGIDDLGFNPIPQDTFYAYLDYLITKKDSLWIASMGEVVRYIRERQSASLYLLDTTNSTITYSLTDTLPDSLYHVPLTVKVKLPRGFANIAVTQDSAAVWSMYTREQPFDYAFFDAVPDRGAIRVTATAYYEVDTVIPVVTITPPSGTYPIPQRVELISSKPGVIYFTLDGTAPTTASRQYSSPILIDRCIPVKFFCMDTAANVSPVVDAEYIIEDLTSTVLEYTHGSIRFTIDKISMVSIQCYDLRGCLIRTVFSGVVKKGETPGVSLDPMQLAGGIYIIRIKTSNMSRFKRILLSR
jgi:oligosaccharide reducing-end xylanase